MPEALLEDTRLDLDSRAVAAWLAIKPTGWQISIRALRSRLCLGKERWRRIAGELEAAEYLFRRKHNGPRGQWIWHVIFNPVPPRSADPGTMGGFPAHGSAASGSAVAGSAVAGSAVAGEPGYKEIPRKTSTNQTTTTSRTEAPARPANDPAADVNVMASAVVVDKWAEPHRELLFRVLARARLNDHDAQQIVDEFAGVLEAASRGEHPAIRNKRGWLNEIIARQKSDDFDFEFGRPVAARRQRLPAQAEPLARASPQMVDAQLEDIWAALKQARGPA
ncbi:hypothetical protein [Burkholderia vietnamiensis]|uniref:hypothetical protein n=1 Tax=Burkholderia vietnamiensis TaxID=60552 RepID=UPI001CF49BDC|nr:hypothetical protein [Burkholderia vietnamiensis]MCA8290027.1 hypothetical protein [Burkholderia vietnamiensis]